MQSSIADAVRRLMSFPGVVEGVSYGTPSFKVNRKLLAGCRYPRAMAQIHAGNRERLEREAGRRE